MDLQDVNKHQLLSTINQKVLPGFGVPMKLNGLLAYGSRATGHSRHDSDLDLLALVEDENQSEFYGEFHGHIEMHNISLPVEMRFYSLGKFQKLLDDGEPYRIHAISQGLTVFDDSHCLKIGINSARLRMDEMLKEFSDQLEQIEPEEVLPQLQILAVQTLSIVKDLVQKGRLLSAQGKFQEFLADYLVYAEGCVRKKIKQPTKPSELMNFFFLQQQKGSRFFNFTRYSWPGVLQKLISSIEADLAYFPLDFEKAFANLSTHFNDNFQRPLLPQISDRPTIYLR